MNEHDSERIAAVLARRRDVPHRRPRRGRRRRAQHLLYPPERRRQAVRAPRPAEVGPGAAAPACRSPSAAASPRRTVSCCWSVLRTSTPSSAPTTSAGWRALLELAAHERRSGARGARRPGRRRGDRLPERHGGAPRPAVRRLGDDPGRLRQLVRLLHRPGGPGAGGEPAVRRARRRARGAGGPRDRRGHAARPERQLLRPGPDDEVAGAPSRRPTWPGSPESGGRAKAPRGPGRLFADLLRALGAVPGIRRVRFTSPHPKDLRPETIAAMAETPAVCEQLHLPLQSGSDRVLAAMRRGYTRRALPAACSTSAGRHRGPRRDDRHHRRVPRGDRGGLRAHPRGRLGGRVRQRLHLHLLAAAGHPGGADDRAVRAARRDRRPVRAAEGRDRALGARPQPGPRRPGRGGHRRGPLQEGPGGAVRAAPARASSSTSPPRGPRPRPGHLRRGARRRTRAPHHLAGRPRLGREAPDAGLRERIPVVGAG